MTGGLAVAMPAAEALTARDSRSGWWQIQPQPHQGRCPGFVVTDMTADVTAFPRDQMMEARIERL